LPAVLDYSGVRSRGQAGDEEALEDSMGGGGGHTADFEASEQARRAAHRHERAASLQVRSV
jgi:hypothetical protein